MTQPALDAAVLEPTTPRRRSRWRWLMLAAGLIVIALAAGWTLLWYTLARDVERVVDDWVAARRTEGYFIVLGAPHVSGFPFRLTLRFELPVAALRGSSTLSWHADWIEASAPLWAPQQIRVRVPRNLFTYSVRGASRDIQVISEAARFDVTANGSGRPETAVIALAQPRLHMNLLAQPIAARDLEIALTWPQLLPGEPFPRAAVSLAASEVTSALPHFAAIGRTIQSLRGNVVFRGTWDNQDWRRALVAWRDNGGTIDLQGLRLEWGNLKVDGDGTAALDRELRPIGAGALWVLGLPEFIDSLQRLGVVNARGAALFKLALSAMPSNGGKTQLPISAQDGRLYLGPVAVAPLWSLDSFSLDGVLRPTN